MSDQHRKRLKEIQTFPALVKYLREDLGWPVDQDSFDDIDDLTFDWDAEELGIDPKQAAKIEYVKQLRPLENGQPQGVFFVKFDTRQLPVVALRKLLQTLVVKKRASAKGADRPMWEMRNLVFISSYGESTERQLCFAYFQEPDSKDERPALKVLGWDEQDTPLHLDKVHGLLQSHLTWPRRPQELPAWRAGWSAAFQVGHGETVRTAKDLAEKLAGLARRIREHAKQLLKIETEKGPLRSLMAAFKKALIHDLTDEQFADMYAQTIAYGLLSARITHPDPIKAETLPDLIPVTNPFLKELMETFVAAGGKRRGARPAHHIDFDELGINDVVELLRRANMDEVLRNFGAAERKEDPVLYFYEGFSKAYDPQERLRRGEFYTPRSVVTYIVRSVDNFLRTEFAIEDGLASTVTWGAMKRSFPSLEIPPDVSADTPFIQILDVAAGTGTFLIEVIEVILATLRSRWNKEGRSTEYQLDGWNDYVGNHLLPRLYGYELRMAPYAIAHLNLGLKLFSTGYKFASGQRARIYLTNTLEPATDAPDSQIDALSEALAHEARAVNEVKREKRFSIILGNPPYSNFGQLNRTPFILGLLESYKSGLQERKLNLDDDFIKFFRLGHYLAKKTGLGILALITNNAYLDGITHRRMRELVVLDFPRIRILDLHGNARKAETVEPGVPDENVFDIMQGVCIGIFATHASRGARVDFADLRGTRTFKYDWLSRGGEEMAFCESFPVPPYFRFHGNVSSVAEEYTACVPLSKVFRLFQSPIQTKRDKLTIQFSRRALEQVLQDFRTQNAVSLRSKYELPPDGRDWKVTDARADVRKADGHIIEISYKPFDRRYTYYSGRSRGFLAYPRSAIMRHVLIPGARALVFKRQARVDPFGYTYFFACSAPFSEGLFAIDPRGREFLAPCEVVGGDDQSDVPASALQSQLEVADRLHNFGEEFLSALSASIGAARQPMELPAGLTARQIFNYIYAVVHSPAYRDRYAAELPVDFPRIPLPRGPQVLTTLAKLGGSLCDIHTGATQAPEDCEVRWVGVNRGVVLRRDYEPDHIWLNSEKAYGFAGVPPSAWNFRIGAYLVCDTWLKQRLNRELSATEKRAFAALVWALEMTLKSMERIDQAIDHLGGWANAFAIRSDTNEIGRGPLS